MSTIYTNAGLNKVILVGHIIDDPRWVAGHKSRQLTFTFRTGETIRTNGADIEHEEFHQIMVDEKNPVLKRVDFEPSDLLYIQGKIHTRAAIDEKHIKRYYTMIMATHIERLVFRVKSDPAQLPAVRADHSAF